MSNDKNAVTKEQIESRQFERVKEKVEFSKKSISKNCEGAEAVLITFHVVKEGRIYHHFEYSDFPNGDWGKILVALAIESRQAELRALTGSAKT